MTGTGLTGNGLTGRDGIGNGSTGRDGTGIGGAAALERRYRRLLLAYPRSYRRRHGTEVLTTLMDAATPGRDRPTGREIRNLLAGGLRQRFRLPVGRPMIAVAALSALVLGALGSAVGSALGWATAAAPPTDAALGTVATVAVGQPARWNVQRDNQIFGLQPRAIVSLAVPTDWTAEAARSRLAAQGWRVGPIETRVTTVSYDDGTTLPADDVMFVAERNGTEILVSGVMERRYSPHAMVMAHGTEPWPVLPLTLAGLIAGLLAGWLLAARVGYRVRRLSPWMQMPPLIAASVAGLALGLSGLLTFRAVGEMVVKAIGPKPTSPDRFESGTAFAVYHVDSPLDPILLTGLGTLVLLLLLTYAMPANPQPDAAATT